jgi:energy-coupling factor transporter ATP-binding protein EcfA2
MHATIDNIVLTEDQQNALDAFYNFLIDPVEQVFVLRGYSGCGKSTLVRTLIDRLPGFYKTAKLINPSQYEYETELTATTNKAAENLSQITGMGVGTIHSFLGLRVQTDFKTNVTTLIPRSNQPKEGYLLFIDEASYIDKQLLQYVFQLTRNCKVVFIGDPAQLTPVKSTGTPVFDANFNGAALTTVVRQAEGNPIVDLSTKFRHTVNTGEFFSFKPDGEHVVYMSREEFRDAIQAEFTRPNWRYQDSKILAWTNKCVIGYNHFVAEHVKGDPDFQVGDYAVCNTFIAINRSSIKTDQLVQITTIEEETTEHDVVGNWITVDYTLRAFHPKSLQERNARAKRARADNDIGLVAEIESQWIDLRAAYACTINKAQGSTFDRVFVDLDDIRRCNSGDQIARMLYVGVSRARHQVFLTGDLV